MTIKAKLEGITLEIPGIPPMILSHLFLDFNGTLALDGKLLPGVAERIRALAALLSITVVTADTFGTAAEVMRGLPVQVQIAKTGSEKADLLKSFGDIQAVAIGNGRNDVEMFRQAALSIAVVGPEGVSSDLISASRIMAGRIEDALDLLLTPVRLKATLRA